MKTLITLALLGVLWLALSFGADEQTPPASPAYVLITREWQTVLRSRGEYATSEKDWVIEYHGFATVEEAVKWLTPRPNTFPKYTDENVIGLFRLESKVALKTWLEVETVPAHVEERKVEHRKWSATE